MDFICQIHPPPPTLEPPTPVLNGQYQAGWNTKQSQIKIICSFYIVLQVLTLFRMSLFWGCLWMGVASPFLSKICHTLSYIDETWHSYTLPKEDPKHT